MTAQSEPHASRHSAPPTEFSRGLIRQMPRLRAFAIRLASDPTRADDLVQETMAKALDKRESYTMGTNLRAWLFAILKNTFYSEFRRGRREVIVEDVPENDMSATMPPQEASMRLNEVTEAIRDLSTEQQEAVLLVGAAELTYEEAAERSECAIGTIKSRVSRARAALRAT